MRSALLLLLLALSPAWAGPLHVEGGRFVDDKGATVILRGVNVAGDSKVPPFRPDQPAIFAPLPNWGLDVVRLLFTWEAYEPQPGQYDDGYLDYYRAAVEAAWAQGLYVIVDFHQDGFSRWLASGCGEGFPQWAIPPTVTLHDPDNGAACVNWGSKVLGDDGVQASWNAFYSDTYGTRTRFISMIGRVASALAGEPGVIGYDLLNEPWGDEPTQIGPLYELAAPAIRAANPDAILFISPTMLTSGGRQTELVQPTFDNLAYAPHYYDPGLFLFHGWSGTEPDEVFGFMSTIARGWNAALFLGEFGAPPSADEQGPYLDTMYAHLDAVLGSGAQWVYTPGWTEAKKDGWNLEDFSIVDDKGAPRANFRPRPYAQRIAGVPTSMQAKGSVFTLEWQNDPAAGDTVVFAPAGDVTAGGDLSCTRKSSLVSCRSTTPGQKRIQVAPAPPSSCGLTGAEPLLILLIVWGIRQRAAFTASNQASPKRSSGSR
jgi:endoglycosylceramidase